MRRIHTGPMDHLVALGVPLFIIASLSQMNGLGVGSTVTLFSAMFASGMTVIVRRMGEEVLGNLVKRARPVTFYAFYGAANALIATLSFKLFF